MCGICGCISLRGEPVSAELVSGMAAALRHRGPDAAGVHVDGPVGLGHTRLSIIDLVGGGQPMRLAGHNIWITYNGEIFNYLELREKLIGKGHQFSTRSDTEVILHMYQEYGEQCVERLNGQWAFAIWDGENRRLFLSRDRLGVRPLYYTETAGHFYFASEIKSLFQAPGISRELDLTALDEIFTFWITLPPNTAFRDVRQLPPGHSLILERGVLRIFPHWQFEPNAGANHDQVSEADLAQELLTILADATRIRLRSDVPVAAYLSGGLDSTVTAALARAAAGSRLKTFSIGFDDPEYDETRYQREASRFLGTEHSEVLCTPRDIREVFPDVVWHTEQPILRTAPAPMFLLSRLVRESGYKVVVTGEGADELLGGYDIFKEAKIRHFWARQPHSAWRPMLLKRLYPYVNDLQRQSSAYLKQFFHVTKAEAIDPCFSHLPRWGLTSKIKQFYSEELKSVARSTNPVAAIRSQLPPTFDGATAFAKAEYLEAAYLLPGYILSSQGDRMAMAHAVEGRFPFLDHRVVEFAARLPSRLKMKVLDQKYLLKRAATGMIPESIRSRHKQPYRAPEGRCFIGPFKSYADDLLSQGLIARNRIFEPRAVSALVGKFKSGNRTSVRDNMALIGILSTQLLIDRFVDRCPPSGARDVIQSVPYQHLSDSRV